MLHQIGAAYAAPNKGTTIYTDLGLLSSVLCPTEKKENLMIFQGF